MLSSLLSTGAGGFRGLMMRSAWCLRAARECRLAMAVEA
jgi:hypothetical protein